MRDSIGNKEKIAQALLLHRNTPLKGSDASPAQLLMGRNLRDFVPQPPAGYRVSNKWKEFLRHRESSMRQNATKLKCEEQRKVLLGDLPVGCEVLCQNTHNNQWDKSGIVVDCCGFRQYKVKLHGSGRITLRNRIHLRRVHVFKSSLFSESERGDVNPLSNVADRNEQPVYSPVDITDRVVDNNDNNVEESTVEQSNINRPLHSRGATDSYEAHTRPTRNRTIPDRYGDWEYH